MVRLFGREDRRREQLLSAYVDGEVTAEEAREVEELLVSSEDARPRVGRASGDGRPRPGAA